MSIRAAILRAADRIEREPGIYDFDAMRTPNEDGDCPACMWGWIGYELGMYEENNARVAASIGVNRTMDLYEFAIANEPCGFTESAASAAKLMRAFADRYFPETSIPESVRAIFNTAQTDVDAPARERAA